MVGKTAAAESSGEHKGEFNLKLLAWAPLVMNVRILSINQGIPATNTVERITLLEKEGSYGYDAATAEYQISQADNVVVTVGSGKSLAISGIISNTTAAKTLTFSGSGTNILSSANSYGPAAGSSSVVSA